MATHKHSEFTINRSLIVLVPNQPAFDWIMQADPEPMQMTLAQLRQNLDGMLVSQEKVETLEDAQRWVYRRWEMLFERFLYEWYTAEELWPRKRTLKMFKEWFEVQYHPMLWDFGDEMIEHEYWGDLSELPDSL